MVNFRLRDLVADTSVILYGPQIQTENPVSLEGVDNAPPYKIRGVALGRPLAAGRLIDLLWRVQELEQREFLLLNEVDELGAAAHLLEGVQAQLAAIYAQLDWIATHPALRRFYDGTEEEKGNGDYGRSITSSK